MAAPGRRLASAGVRGHRGAVALLPEALASVSRRLLAETIQLAITPVLLLTAIGGFLSAMTTRLGPVIDRARAIEEKLGVAVPDPRTRAGLLSLDRRIRLANAAVGFSIASALLLCLLIALLFVSRLAPRLLAQPDPPALLPLMFIAVLALLALLTLSLLTFLLEVRIALRTARVSAELLRRTPETAAEA